MRVEKLHCTAHEAKMLLNRIPQRILELSQEEDPRGNPEIDGTMELRKDTDTKN
jgi:hypothetical protein